MLLFWQGVSSNNDIQMQKKSSTSVNCKLQETYQLTYTPTLSDDNSLVTCVAKQASGNEIVSDAKTLRVSGLRGIVQDLLHAYLWSICVDCGFVVYVIQRFQLFPWAKTLSQWVSTGNGFKIATQWIQGFMVDLHLDQRSFLR